MKSSVVKDHPMKISEETPSTSCLGREVCGIGSELVRRRKLLVSGCGVSLLVQNMNGQFTL